AGGSARAGRIRGARRARQSRQGGMTMALSLNVSLEDALAQFRGLNLNEPETWPDVPRYTIMALVGVLVVVLGWQFYWSDKFAERDAARARQAMLRQDF